MDKVSGGWGRIREGGEFGKKYANVTNTKMNLCRKSHTNRTMGKCSKIGGMVFGKEGEFEGGGILKKMQVTNAIPK